MAKRALVIGATGLLGYDTTVKLSKAGWQVRAIGIERPADVKHLFGDDIEYIGGDFYDEKFLESVLIGVDKVFYFLASTFPSTSSDSLSAEVNKTLYGLDHLIRKMRDFNVKQLVFPSSGGTVYGNAESGVVSEDSALNPTTPYGVGKKMCEEILKFYSRHGVNSTVLRIGNVYGSKTTRSSAQGVIDVFVQKGLKGETAEVWSDALSNVRDYIFSDDLSDAIVKIGEIDSTGYDVYNLSSGVGVTLSEIVDIINKYIPTPLKVTRIENACASSIKRIVLDMNKFFDKTGWRPKYDIESGIKETIKRKTGK